MNAAKQIEVLNSLLKSKNPDYQELAKLKLAELAEPVSNDADIAKLRKAAKSGKLHKLPKAIFTQFNILGIKVDDTIIHTAAKYGHLDQLPEELLTERNLLTPNKKGYTPLYLCAENGHLNQIPSWMLTAKNLRANEEKGRSAISAAARTKHIDQVPSKAFEEIVIQHDIKYTKVKGSPPRLGEGAHVLHEMQTYDCLHQAPKALLTEKRLLAPDPIMEYTMVHWLANSGHLDMVPASILVPKNLLLKTTTGKTVLHCCAISGNLDAVPKQYITLENVLVKNNDGDTVLHAFAEYGHLDKLPATLLTKQSVAIKNKAGLSTIHMAAGAGRKHCRAGLAQIPKAFITQESLLEYGANEHTTVFLAVASGELTNIPTELLTAETLLAETPNRQNIPLHRAAELGYLDQIPRGVLTSSNLLVQDCRGNSPLSNAFKHGYSDQLLGLELEDNQPIREIVGDDWWARNKKLLADRACLTTTTSTDGKSIDLF